MTNRPRTRAEIQAEIEKLENEIATLEAGLEQAWPRDADNVYMKGTVRQSDDDSVDVQIEGDGDTFQIAYSALIPAADLIPREEHEREVEMARKLDANTALKYLVNEYDLDTAHNEESGARTYVHEHSASKYRVTVERVDAPTKPSDAEPVMWMNVYKDGEKAAHQVKAHAQIAACVGVVERAVPLYRHPVNVEIVLDEYGPGIEGKQVLAMCDGKLLKCVHLTDLLPAEAQGTAVATQGVVEEMRSGIKYMALNGRCKAVSDQLFTALSRITELPEPSEWTTAKMREPFFDRLSWEERLSLAAALLESAKEAE